MYAFTFEAPATVADAAALAQAGGKLLAGGQTLLPSMKLRLSAPEQVVDLNRIPSLAGIRREGQAFVIGAMTRHADVAANAELQAAIPALANLAAHIGDRQVRARGTLGGSVANNDPAACYPSALLALGALDGDPGETADRKGDILIGKITPKGESDPTPEEKLLRAIFGDKAGDVKDASLKASPSLNGVVIDKKLFSRVVKEKKGKVATKPLLEQIDRDFEVETNKLRDILVEKLFNLVNGKTSQGVKDYFNADLIPKGVKFTQKQLQMIDYLNVNPGKWTTDKDKNDMIYALVNNFIMKYKEAEAVARRKRYNVTIGDELPAGILQLAKVYIAKKRKLQIGDKMAGRHGNKGIVSRIVRDEDMPFLSDGTPVDIVLNPLGVPSRMNLGQIYETVLGWAGKELGVKFATPIFDGATLAQISEYTEKAGVSRFGKTWLHDGETGEKFDQPATVGVIYMLKLGHMVEDKMHARSIGPYSLITQQPLGGKAQFGGQRFGEMEVWALEAFGASNILQEILTVKSDDVMGRAKAYEAIVKGDPMPQPGIPESLNVLLHELRGLGLSVNLE